MGTVWVEVGILVMVGECAQPQVSSVATRQRADRAKTPARSYPGLPWCLARHARRCAASDSDQVNRIHRGHLDSQQHLTQTSNWR